MLVLFPFLFGFACPATAAPEARVSETYGKLPLHFEANQGQTHQDVRFLARGPGYSLYLTAGEAVLVLTKPNPDATQARATPVVVRMSVVGAAPKPLVSGLDELPGKANYLIGNPAKWRTNVPTYAKVHYRAVYPGIDLVYYGNQRQLEYDFVVSPGADPERIVLGFQGAERLEINAEGELVLHAAGGVIRQRVPVIYQEIDGVRTKIEGGYVLKDAHRVGFQVAAYDPSRPLVIDPTLVYFTYLGGSIGDGGRGIAVDAAGAAYVTGYTLSTDFTAGCTAPCTVLDATLNGGRDAFVTKINAAGTALVYSTYLGGSNQDEGVGIAVDAAGAAYLTGLTQSADFTAGCTAPCTVLNGTLRGYQDAFVTKINAAGTALVYSTHLGGSSAEDGNGIAVDAAGAAYVTGTTQSADFTAGCTAPCTVLNGTLGGLRDAFVTKLNATGMGLVYSTYLGGSSDQGGFGIAVEAAGAAYVTGERFKTVNTVSAAFVAKIAEPAFHVARADFNGDGRADILWRNSSTGENYLWLMNGTTITGEGSVRTEPDQNWKVAGVGDFNGDGTADILWRNSSTGENYVYLMKGTTITGEGYLAEADLNWQVAGVGDFNGDGKADILWRNSSTGENYVYLMNGTTNTGAYLRTLADLNWQVQNPR